MRAVLCFGDSNTHGTIPMPTLEGLGRFGHEGRWPSVMAADLGPGYEVIAEGHPGRTTVLDDPMEGEHRSGIRVLPSLLASHTPLDIVILNLGTNDLKNCFHVSAADIAFFLDRLVRVVQGFDAGIRVLVVAPPPIVEVGCLAEMFAGAAAKSQRLAPAIKAMTERLGVGFFDAGTVIGVSPVDGIHYEAGDQATLGLALGQVVRGMLDA